MRAKKSFKNLIFNIIQQIIGIFTSFLLPPLIIKNFGSTINGLIQTIKQIMNYAQITGAGIASTSTYALYEPIIKKNTKEINGIYNAANKMFNKAGIIFSILVLLISIFYPLLVGSQVNKTTTFLLIIIISFCGISEFFIFGKYQVLINADQNNYIIALAQTIGNICNILVTFILIILKQNIIIVQLGGTIIYLIRITILKIYVNKHYRYLDKTIEPLNKKLNQKNDAIIHQIAGLVVLSSSTVIVSLFCGLVDASIFATYNLVFAGLNTICYVVTTSIYASFGDVIAKNDKKVLKNAFNIYEWFYFIMISIVFSVAYLMITPFIKIYTSGFTDANYVLPLLGALFVVVGLANNIRVPSVTLVNAAGHYKQTKNRAIVEMLINLCGQLLFVNIFGIYGVLIGCICSYCYRTVDYIIYVNKHILKQKSTKSFKRVIMNVILIPIIVQLIKLMKINQAVNIMEWIIHSTIITIIISLFFILINYFIEPNTFKETKKTIISIFNNSAK